MASPGGEMDSSRELPNWFRTRSPDHAIHLCETAFHPHRLELLESGGFGFAQHLTRAGPITLADLTYDTDVSLSFAGDRDSYYIHLTLDGRLESQYLGRHLVSTPAVATIYRPEAEMSVTRWPGGTRHLGIKIDQLVVDTALKALLGRSPESSVAFTATLPLSDHAAQSWVSQVRWINREFARPDSPLQHPAVLDPLVESVVCGLLLVAGHPDREGLAASTRPVRPPAVRTAMDIIESKPQSALTTSRLALECHVSVRALQEGFHRHVGMSPMAYLRQVRLRRVRADLRAAHSSHTGVAAVAHRWGFGHLGRFAAAYKVMYGETPLQTLRAGGD